MTKLTKSAGAFALAIAGCSLLRGQPQQSPSYTRDICVKVRDGKNQEYSAFLRDVVLKLAKVRVESGMYSGFVLAQAVVPSGRSAVCEYHLVYGSAGFPPELASAEQTTADLKKAGVAMTVEQMFAKRDELSYLVGIDIWQDRLAVVGTAPGRYGRLNYFRTKPGASLADWVRLESTGWKQLAEDVVKTNSGSAWLVETLVMPGGTDLKYNGLTVDIFPSWADLGKGVGTRAIWNRVHPDMDFSAYMDRVGAVVDRPRVDIVRFLANVRGKAAATTGE